MYCNDLTFACPTKDDFDFFDADGNEILPDQMGSIGANMEVLSKRVKLRIKDHSGKFKLAK